MNGIEEARVHAPGVDSGVNRDWSLLAPSGAIGGAGGPGVLPFPATRSRGELAGVSVIDRALRQNEMQSEYARYALNIYCQGRANTAGTVGRLGLEGSFRRQDDRLYTVVDGLPPGTVGFLLGSLEQHRTDISNGTLCVRGQILRFSKQVFVADPAGHAGGPLRSALAPVEFVNSASPLWNFQFWYRDGGGSNFTNGLQVTFGG